MFDWFPYRLTVAPTDTPARPRGQARSRMRKRLALVAGGLASLGATGIFSLPVAAGTTGSVTATIPIAILSLTVSPNTVTLANCVGGSSTPTALGFPNANCNTNTPIGKITITNSGGAGTIQVQGSDAVPQGGGTPHWTLCLPTNTCSGPGPIASRPPGTDQFVEFLTNSSNNGGLNLTNGPQCDRAFTGSGCHAASGASAVEILGMTGPTSSTSSATSFTTSVTWTVVL